MDQFPASRLKGVKKQQIKSKLSVIFWFMLFWLLLSFYQYWDHYTLLSELDSIPWDYHHWPHIRGLLISLAIGGLVLSTALFTVWERWSRKMAFGRALTSITLFYTVLYLLIRLLALVAYPIDDSSANSSESSNSLLEMLFSVNQVPNFLFWLFVMLMSMGILLVRDKFGPGVFLSFVKGKYFRPKREDRVVMFMDLKSSTTIAEKLGEQRYFSFLNDAFTTATPGILATQGEIYQYVGDEIVVTWPKNLGANNANCVQCFFEMTRLLKEHSQYFEDNYGFQPIFKAGLHSGYVIAGEMGIIKREIVYSEDVLNTTARIQSKCNEHDVRILVSKTLLDQINLSELGIEPTSLGKVILRGKSEELEVFTL